MKEEGDQPGQRLLMHEGKGEPAFDTGTHNMKLTADLSRQSWRSGWDRTRHHGFRRGKVHCRL